MTTPRAHVLRSDAAKNRERLIEAARRVFAELGQDAPLEEVARAASVSRMTLYRNFTSREELAAVVLEANVASIEKRAAELAGRPDAVITLFDFVLDQQRDNRALVTVLAHQGIDAFAHLSERTITTFLPLLGDARRAGLVHPDVGIEDVMTAFPMADGAMADNARSGRRALDDHVRGMLHRALWTTP